MFSVQHAKFDSSCRMWCFAIKIIRIRFATVDVTTDNLQALVENVFFCFQRISANSALDVLRRCAHKFIFCLLALLTYRRDSQTMLLAAHLSQGPPSVRI